MLNYIKKLIYYCCPLKLFIQNYCCPLKLFIQNKLGLTLLTKYQPF